MPGYEASARQALPGPSLYVILLSAEHNPGHSERSWHGPDEAVGCGGRGQGQLHLLSLEMASRAP